MFSESENEVCFVCDALSTMVRDAENDIYQVECPRCGTFQIFGSTISVLGKTGNDRRLLNTDAKKAAVGYWLRAMQRLGETPILNADKAEQLSIDLYFPPVKEQLDLLVEHVGDTASAVGVPVDLDADDIQYIFGGASPDSLDALLDHLAELGFIKFESPVNRMVDGTFSVRITVSGWLEYEEIKRGRSTGRHAFMAMPFGESDLNERWLPSLRKAVEETGFILKRVDDTPQPGLIDTKMRLEIEAARFLIVELTHANNGAYWEGGFAEGLGKPVIYLCRKDTQPHFDVEHSFRINWDPDNMEPAFRTLKATIRNALPDAKPEPE